MANVTKRPAALSALNEVSRFALGAGVMALYVGVVCYLMLPPGTWYQSLAIGVGVAFFIGGIAWAIYSLISAKLNASTLMRALAWLVGLTVAALLLGYAISILFSHWGSTFVFDTEGHFLGYGPSPAEGGFTGVLSDGTLPGMNQS